jgi:diaminopimelate decarboxylase
VTRTWVVIKITDYIGDPLTWFLKANAERGLGAECASIVEVQHAIEAGHNPSNVVFDSPAKTRRELAWALQGGVHINIDNFQELERVVELRASMTQASSNSVIGLRINPCVGMSATLSDFCPGLSRLLAQVQGRSQNTAYPPTTPSLECHWGSRESVTSSCRGF